MSHDPPSAASPPDVRMRGFAQRTTLAEAIAWIDARAQALAAERTPLATAAGRVLAEEVVSDVSVPSFERAMMDGYAVQASDTLGAGPYNPLPLRVLGEALAGRAYQGPVQSGECVRIMTGAPLPLGADAVLPAENATHEGRTIVALEAMPPGKHVGSIGEDVAAGSCLLRPGRRLRPQDVAILSSIGRAEVLVVRRPRVRIVVTGNELLPAGTRPHGSQIADANGPLLQALVQRDGGEAVSPPLVRDERADILAAMQSEADLVLVSGGSSVGQEDFAPQLLAEYGELAIHGIAMRPSSPAGLGLLAGRIVCLLPGNPVSCLCAYDFLAGRAVRLLGGRSPHWQYPCVQARLARKLVSQPGRVDYCRVRFVGPATIEPLAISGASVLSSTVRADGFVVVPADLEGFAAQATVDVHLYDIP